MAELQSSQFIVPQLSTYEGTKSQHALTILQWKTVGVQEQLNLSKSLTGRISSDGSSKLGEKIACEDSLNLSKSHGMGAAEALHGCIGNKDANVAVGGGDCMMLEHFEHSHYARQPGGGQQGKNPICYVTRQI